jgi:acyl dehydratase
MASNHEAALALFQKQIGVVEGPSEWLKIEQDRINAFADATGDHQFIHVDPERAKATPFRTTIAHGFLTLSLIPYLQGRIRPSDPGVMKGLAMAVNYGLEKVRFPAPVPVNSRIRATRELLSVEVKGPNTLQTTQKVTLEAEGSEKPVCVAEALTRWIYT